MTEDLIQKLMISKKIMDKHKEMPRGQVSEGMINTQSQTPNVENFAPVQGTYNIPEEYTSAPTSMSTTKKETSKESILKSKLPDNIKRLMLEHPINVPSQSSPVLTDDLVEKASRLMRKENLIESKPTKNSNNLQKPQTHSNDDLKSIIRETMEEILKENGLLIENVSKTDDVFSFRVGSHIFEGKVTKIKKIK